MARFEGRAGVRIIALLFVFVLLNTLFMAGIVFSRDVDAANRAIALGILIPLMLASIAFATALVWALFAERISRRRWTRINRRLRQLGFREATPLEVADTLGLPVHLLSPAVLAAQRGGGIDHVTVGRFEDRDVRCFNVRIRGGGWVDVPAVAIRLDASLAATMIRPSKIRIPPRPGLRKVLFEHEVFNRSFAVFSADPYVASAVVDARMMEWLMKNQKRATLELADSWAVMWRMRSQLGALFRPEGPEPMMELGERFAKQIPRVTGSLFPGTARRLRWQHRRQ